MMFMRVQSGTYESSRRCLPGFLWEGWSGCFLPERVGCEEAGAERWLGWNAEICFGEEAVDREPARMLGEALKSWKEARMEW
jgi:hypothetical protein